MASGRCRGWSRPLNAKCYSQRLEFSETCLECRGIYFGGLVGHLPGRCNLGGPVTVTPGSGRPTLQIDFIHSVYYQFVDSSKRVWNSYFGRFLVSLLLNLDWSVIAAISTGICKSLRYKLPDHLIIFARWQQQHKNGWVTLGLLRISSLMNSATGINSTEMGRTNVLTYRVHHKGNCPLFKLHSCLCC